jgi:DNA-binding NtrC family response regulator
MATKILIIDDEEVLCGQLRSFFEFHGFEVTTAHRGAQGIELVRNEDFDVALLDLHLPDMSGLDVLEALKDLTVGMGVVMLTGYGDVETAVKALQLRADHFLLKPVELAALSEIVNRVLDLYQHRRTLKYLQERVASLQGGTDVSKLILPVDLFERVRVLAESSATSVLILGETGSGKGVVANAIHTLSDRREMPFVDINCAGLSASLLESNLFGHERGAFTDAKTTKRGLFEVANRGTLFLDEIADMPLDVQAKLLKVLEDRLFRRLGGTATIRVDVRIIAATNADIERRVKDGSFRADLYYRLAIMPVNLPPLRQRTDDVPLLAQRFVGEFAHAMGKPVKGCSAEAINMLKSYRWPGNVRELRNVIERAVLLCEDREIQPVHLPQGFRHRPRVRPPAQDEDLRLEVVEADHIRRVLALFKNNRTHAAVALGINRVTLIKKIRRYKLDDS